VDVGVADEQRVARQLQQAHRGERPHLGRHAGQTPRVALVSHSSFGTARNPSASKMREALRLITEALARHHLEGVEGDVGGVEVRHHQEVGFPGEARFRFGTARNPSASKMREALRLITEREPDLEVEGEMQADPAGSARR
jgi:hypothetical protein